MKIKDLYINSINWKFILSISVSVLALFYTLNNFQVDKLFDIIARVKLRYIFSAVSLLILSVFLRALRWKLLFDNKKISIKNLFNYQLIGYFGNNVFPLRAGEFLRCIFLSKDYNISKSTAFGTVVLERFLDIIGMIALLGSLLFLLEVEIQIIYWLVLVLLVIILFIIYKFNFLYNGNNRILLIINDIMNGFRSLSYLNIIPTIIYTIFIWSIYTIIVYLVQYSMNLNIDIINCIFILFISSLALAIPSAPANIGTFELSVVSAMNIIGIFMYQLEFAIILHLVTFIPYTIIGGILFIYYNYQVLGNKK